MHQGIFQKYPGQKPGYLPTLDGWRAIAILAVIFYHDVIHAWGPLSTRWIYEYGSAGVDVFFAISGILICTRLLAEEELEGRINLRQFYKRRCLRILPSALFYLAVLAVLSRLSVISVNAGGWLSSLLFCRNYPNIFRSTNDVAGWYTSHFWSLSLEEQFYFLLPAVLVLTARRYRTAVFVSLAAFVFMHRWHELSTHSWLQIQFHAGTRIDALLVPALFAVWACDTKRRAVLRNLLRFWPWMTACVLLAIPFGKGTAWHVSLLIWSMPCIVLGSVLNPNNLAGAVLEWKPLRLIGRISYSLYLWQQLFFHEHFAPGLSSAAGWQAWPLRLILTFGSAFLSYRLIELPLSRLGRQRALGKPPVSETSIAVRPAIVRVSVS